jgi:hypothetical protein
LVQVGFDSARIEVNLRDSPRLSVAVGPGEAAEVEMVIHAAEEGDPDGSPSFWELARHQHIYPQSQEGDSAVERGTRSASFVIGWRPLDDVREVTQATADMNLRAAYLDHWGA